MKKSSSKLTSIAVSNKSVELNLLATGNTPSEEEEAADVKEATTPGAQDEVASSGDGSKKDTSGDRGRTTSEQVENCHLFPRHVGTSHYQITMPHCFAVCGYLCSFHQNRVILQRKIAMFVRCILL